MGKNYQRRADLLVAMQIREDTEKYHQEYLDKVKHEHEHHLARLEGPPSMEVHQNDSELPLVLSNGVVVQPGNFHAINLTSGEPFGISAEELEAEYVEANDPQSS